MRTIALYIAITFLFVRCANQVATHDNMADTIVEVSYADRPADIADMHNSANSLDWQGTYKGVLPCADCKGIETVITLNDDKTYIRKMSYLGKSGKIYEHAGTFMWDDQGQSITLNDADNGLNKYSIGENVLYQLDVRGDKIAGELADKYILKKSSRSAALRGSYWKLVELLGRPVKLDNGKEIYIRMTPDGKVQAAGGCNNLAGGYVLMDDNRIRFTKLVSTEMVCPAMHIETEFLNVLANADGYILDGNTLYLIKARKANLAEFAAVPGK